MSHTPASPAFVSPACEVVMQASHPTPDEGGPCATCAFRPGTQANQSAHTIALVTASVEGLKLFHCHERPMLCRGFIAAVNLRGVPETEDERRHCEAAGLVADVLGDAIQRAADAQGSPR